MSKSKRHSPRVDDRSRENSTDVSPPSLGATTKREWVFVAIVLAIGIGSRVALPSRMAIEHFDEGVYASNFWFGPEVGFQYPKRRFYAPPLLPSLIEWSIIFNQIGSDSSGRVSLLTPIVPSLLAGCVTLGLVWRMAREWFGARAALATLTIASLSEFHAVYSRAALTEALMLMFFVAAVWTLKRAFSSNSYVCLGFAGLFTGLAWWTKYNGWLPLAVGFGGLVVAFTIDQHFRKHAVRLVGFWIGTAAIAFAVWSPYLRELQSLGGYAGVAENHGQYIVGVSGWAASLSQQYANLSHFDGWATSCSLGIAMLLAYCVPPMNHNAKWKRCVQGIGLCAAGAWFGTALVMLALSIWFICQNLYRRVFASRLDDSTDDLALYFLAAWIGGLFLVTPLYHPYPRLTLPLLCAIWIGAGAAISRVAELALHQSDNRRASAGWMTGGVVAAILLLPAIPKIAGRGMNAWQPRTGWVPVARRIVAEVGDRAEAAHRDRDGAIVFVYGEPGLFYHLNVEDTQVFIPAGDLDFIDGPKRDDSIPTFLIAGPHAERTASFQDERDHHRDQLKLIAELEFTASDLVLLNLHHPRSLDVQGSTIRSERVTLYQIVGNRTP